MNFLKAMKLREKSIGLSKLPCRINFTKGLALTPANVSPRFGGESAKAGVRHAVVDQSAPLPKGGGVDFYDTVKTSVPPA